MTRQFKPAIDHFNTNVAGVTHRNSNRISRQSIIRNFCIVGVEVLLIPDPDNRYDSNAIEVRLPNKHQIGYLNSEFAGVLTRKKLRKQGANHRAFINRVGRFVNDEGEKVWFVELTVLEWNDVFDIKEASAIFEDLRLQAQDQNAQEKFENILFVRDIIYDCVHYAWKFLKNFAIISKKLIVSSINLSIVGCRFSCKTISSAWQFFINSN